jgi:NADPH:quinone reductase-like Zn-dependent oxidoreductase
LILSPDINIYRKENETMRAAVITEHGAMPRVQEFDPPTAVPGAVLIDVDTAGLGGWDVLGAYRLGVEYPCVIRGEGVGRNPDGRRVCCPSAPGRNKRSYPKRKSGTFRMT